MSSNFKVFIGWDSREDIAYEVAKHSILKYNPDVEIIPLKLYELREQGLYTRADDKKGSTEFTISRFLVPFLSGYKGWSVFMDCDVLARENVANIVLDANENDGGTSMKDVYCVQHDYSPKSKMKMDGQMQHIYPRKNWSSVMLFNNSQCQTLTPDVVNNETPMYLHRLMWAETVGELSYQWNNLAGYYDGIENEGIIHYTDGGPWFENHRDCPHATLWQDELREMFGI